MHEDIHEYEKQDGLSCVTKDPKNIRAHLVFVHGLQGGAFSTWNSGDKTELGFWPAVVAKNHPWCCVWTLHYTANILDYPFARSQTIDLLDKSTWLMDQLVQNRINKKPVIFVSHSLGGVLVKQALQFSQLFGDDDWRLVWKQTQAVVFLATPHVGSRLADIAIALANGIRASMSGLPRLLLRPSRALKNLKKNNPTLVYLRNWYRNHAPTQGIETIAYAEGRALVGTLVVVNVEDANPQVANCPTVPLSDQDHISIAKPDNKRRDVYRRVHHYLEDLKKRLEDGRIQTIPSPTREEAAMRKLAEKRDWISSLSGYWWELIKIDDKTEVSFFEIRPHSLSNSVSCEGKHYTENGEHISNWHSVIAGVEKEQNKIVLSYHWEGTRTSGMERGLQFQGFGKMRFPEPKEPGDRIDRAIGGFWDVKISQPKQTIYKSVELYRAVDDDCIRKMTAGTPKAIKSHVLKMLNQ